MLKSSHSPTPPSEGCIATTFVPESAPLPGFAPIETVMSPVKSLTWPPDASYTVIRTGGITWPTCIVRGRSVNSRWFPLGSGGVQRTLKLACPVPPAGTFTVCGFGLVTAQFAATPDRETVRLPEARPVNVTLPLVAIALLVPPSTVTVYPSGSGLTPVVFVVTVRSPVGVDGGMTSNGLLSRGGNPPPAARSV